MDKIPSFTINHLVLEPGVYVSRRDYTPSGDAITTFDVRMTRPNRQAALTPQALHAIEHLAATYLRNRADWGDKLVYWGPMGCCTGNYMVMQGELEPKDVVPILRDTFRFIAEYRGEIPGATPRDCGNYAFTDLEAANAAAGEYLKELESPITEYPL